MNILRPVTYRHRTPALAATPALPTSMVLRPVGADIHVEQPNLRSAGPRAT